MKFQWLLRKLVAGVLSFSILTTGAVSLTQTTYAAPAAQVQASPLVHVVKYGDTLSAIAATYGTSVQALMKLNHLSSTMIYVGQRITILGEALPGSGIGTIYTAVAGDSLSALARRFNTSVSSIMNANGLRSTLIYVGQQLAIPRDFPAPNGNPGPFPPGTDPGPVYPVSYVVQWGDTLSGIAQRYGTTLAAMMEVNQLSSSAIYVGQRLTISVATLPDAPNIPYQVQRGDTLSALAQRYQVSVESIMSINGLVSPLIYVGQTLLIPQSLGYPNS